MTIPYISPLRSRFEKTTYRAVKIIGLSSLALMGVVLAYAAVPPKTSKPTPVWDLEGFDAAGMPGGNKADDLAELIASLHQRLDLHAEQTPAWDRFELALRRSDDAQGALASRWDAQSRVNQSWNPSDEQNRASLLATLFTERAELARTLAKAGESFLTVLDDEQARTFKTYAAGLYHHVGGPSVTVVLEPSKATPFPTVSMPLAPSGWSADIPRIPPR